MVRSVQFYYAAFSHLSDRYRHLVGGVFIFPGPLTPPTLLRSTLAYQEYKIKHTALHISYLDCGK